MATIACARTGGTSRTDSFAPLMMPRVAKACPASDRTTRAELVGSITRPPFTGSVARA